VRVTGVHERNLSWWERQELSFFPLAGQPWRFRVRQSLFEERPADFIREFTVLASQVELFIERRHLLAQGLSVVRDTRGLNRSRLTLDPLTPEVFGKHKDVRVATAPGLAGDEDSRVRSIEDFTLHKG
jgi:hypothetical protein